MPRRPTTKTTTLSESLQDMALLRLPAVLQLFPVSRSSWWDGVSRGVFPKPVKLGPRTVAWRAKDIRALLLSHEGHADASEVVRAHTVRVPRVVQKGTR